MKILFDGTATQGYKSVPFHGGADYAIYVLESALKHGFNNFDIVFNKTMISNPYVLNLIESYGLNTIYLSDKSELYALASSKNYSTFFSALPYNYDKPFDIKFIGVIHGLRNIELPNDDYKYKYETNKLAKVFFRFFRRPYLMEFMRRYYLHKMSSVINNCSVIITVSEHSKYSIIQNFPDVLRINLHTIPSPLNLTFSGKGKNDYGKYYLMVSGNRFEKNAYRAIKAFENLFLKGFLNDSKVVITAGARMAFASEIRCNHKFILLDYVSTEDLDNLYANAFALVYPSLNEGYGYPPIIAMAHGVPVLASSATSIPEVCKNAALYFNPTDVYEISNRILQISINENLRNELIENGRKNVEKIKNSQPENTDRLLKIIFG